MPAWLLLAALAAAQDVSETAPEPTPEAAPVPVTVELLDDGKGRRRPLRIAPAPPDRWQLQLVRHATSTISSPDAEEPITQTAPAAVQVLDAELDDQLTLRLVDSDLEGADLISLAALNLLRESLADVRMVASLEPRHRLAFTLEDVPDEVDPLAVELLGDIGWALGLLAVLLPEEPVGRGARWSWSLPAMEQGVPVDQRVTAELISWRKDTALVALAVELEGEEPSAEVRIDASGGGRIWLDLQRPLASGAEVQLDGTLVAGAAEATFEVTLSAATRDIP